MAAERILEYLVTGVTPQILLALVITPEIVGGVGLYSLIRLDSV
jgi:hypothetical protein